MAVGLSVGMDRESRTKRMRDQIDDLAVPIMRREITMPDENDHHREHRQRVLKGATIILGIRNSEISCTIRNQHAAGAELKVPAEAQIPKEFLLYVAVDGVAYRAVVRWRKNDRVGIQFTGVEPKPRLHYG